LSGTRSLRLVRFSGWSSVSADDVSRAPSSSLGDETPAELEPDDLKDALIISETKQDRLN